MEFHLPAPQPRQWLFINDDHRYVAFGGARGGGKSMAVRLKAIILCLKYPGIKVMIMRKTYPELMANHIEPLRSMILGVAEIKESKKECVFINGSKILFRYAQNEADLSKYQGTEVDVLFIDEATQFTWEMYVRCTAFVRGVNRFPKQIYLTCNPGNVGHDWVKRLFIDREYTETEDAENYSFIKSLVTDNMALMRQDPEYMRTLEALPPKLRQAWLEGDWDIFEGQFFEEFRDKPDRYECEAAGITVEEALVQRKFTHVIPPFEVPRGWEIMRSFDFGYSKPFSCDWWAIDYDSRMYLIMQFYGCTGIPDEGIKMAPPDIFGKIREIESTHRWLKGKNIRGVADPAIWDASSGISIAEVASKAQVYFTPADHTRIPGWMQVHYRMRFDNDGMPMIYFFDTCKHAIRTVPALTYSETVTEDLDTTQEDHFADSMRYACMARPITPRETKRPPARGDDPLDLYRNVKRS